VLPDSRSELVLRFDGLVNARDLGGRRRAGGGRTSYGAFFRSESVDLLSEMGWPGAADAGIRTVVDLRQLIERDRDHHARPDWVTLLAVDLDGLDNQTFWKDYRDNGLCGYLPHLGAMPERAVAALSALVTAPLGRSCSTARAVATGPA